MSDRYDPEIHHRRSIRLRGYDYRQAGVYYVTICVQNRARLFGSVADASVALNEAGQMVESTWVNLPRRFPTVQLDAFVVMPDHLHGIIVLGGAQTGRASSLGDIVGAFKSLTTHGYVLGVRERGWLPFDGKLWQRNYFEHIVRNEDEMDRIRQYIEDNPSRAANGVPHVEPGAMFGDP